MTVPCLCCCRSVTLHNRSKVVVHYQWKAFSSVEEEEAHKQLLVTCKLNVHFPLNITQLAISHVSQYMCTGIYATLSSCSQLDHLAEEETMAKDIFMERCMHNPSLRDRLPILTHSLAHKKKVCTCTTQSAYNMYMKTQCLLRRLECVYLPFYSVLVHSTMLIWKSSSSLMRISPLTLWYVTHGTCNTPYRQCMCLYTGGGYMA